MQSAQERSAGSGEKDHNPLRLGSLRYRLTETSYRKAWRAVIEIAIRGVGDPEQHPVKKDVQKLHISNRFKLRAVLDFVAVGCVVPPLPCFRLIYPDFDSDRSHDLFGNDSLRQTIEPPDAI